MNKLCFALLALTPFLVTQAFSPAALTASELEAEPIIGVEFVSETWEIHLIDLEPGAQVAIFGGGHRLADTVTYSQTHAAVLVDTDEDGEIIFDGQQKLPEVGVFLVVEIATGLIAIASPGQEPRLAEFPPTSFDPGETPEQIFVTTGRSRLMLVRPGVGAWQLQNLEQDELGAASVPAMLMDGLGESPAAPSTFQAGDLLALYDPVATTVAVHRIAALDIANGFIVQEGP